MADGVDFDAVFAEGKGYSLETFPLQGACGRMGGEKGSRVMMCEGGGAKRAAVIGAGAAGLVVSKLLRQVPPHASQKSGLARSRRGVALISCKARNRMIFWTLRELKGSNGSSVD